jgi:hypothetical protein
MTDWFWTRQRRACEQRASPSTVSADFMNKLAPLFLNKLALLFLVIAIALGTLAVRQYQQSEHLRAVIMQMNKDAAAGREESDSQAAELRTLKERTRTQKVAIDQLEARNKELANTPPDSATPAGEKSEGKSDEGGFMKGVAKMFTDPKMKEAMRGQQSAGVAMMYGDLAKYLGLTPDEARQVLALITDRQMEQMNKSMALLNKGTLDAATLTEAGKQGEAAKADYDAALKDVLGKERFAKLQEYEKTMGERFALSQLRNQLSAGGMPLDDNQAAGLLSIMQEERARTPNPMAGNTDPAAQAKLLQNGEMMEGMFKSQEEYNRRVLDRARGVLSPDQLQAFETAQKQQADMQKMGLQMSRELFKKGK